MEKTRKNLYSIEQMQLFQMSLSKNLSWLKTNWNTH